MKPARIALLTESDLVGGAEVMILNLAEALRERGHEVQLVGPANGSGWLGGRFRAAGFRTHEFRLARAVDPGAVRRLAAVFRNEGIDLAHSHMFAMAVYGAAAARRAGIPHVITMHGDEEQTRYLRRRLALRWAFRRSRAAVAVSEAMRAQLQAALGRAARDLRVIINGVPDRRGDRERVRQELGLGPDETLILAVGSLCERKAHGTLLEAAARLPETVRWRVAVAGPEAGSGEALRAAISDRGWEGRVHLLGSRNDVPDLLAAADIYAMPSLWEGLPVALVEAMFAARPIVASRVGGIPEALRDRVEGLLVPANDPVALAEAMTTLAASPERARSLGAAARKAAETRFSVRAMTDAYEGVYCAA